MKFIASTAICPTCGIDSRISFVTDPGGRGYVLFTRVWVECRGCAFIGWVRLRQDWYEIHGNPP